MEISPFDKLRRSISNINSQEELKENMIPILAQITQINTLFLSISIKKTQILDSLKQISNNSQEIREKMQSLIIQCQDVNGLIMAISQYQDKKCDLESLNLIPIDDFCEEANITMEERNAMTDSDLIRKQMEFEIEKFQKLKESYQFALTRSQELKSKLFTINRLYAPIITKLKELDQVVSNFKKNHPEL